MKRQRSLAPSHVAAAVPRPARRAFSRRRKRFFLSALPGASVLFAWVFAFLLWTVPSWAADVTLVWDPNAEADLEGYGVYFSRGTVGPPYELYGYVALADLQNPGAPRFTVSGLEQGTRYYFAVTAYDTEGYESYFSNPACADVGDTVVPCPVPPSSGGSGGGGGGGGACFLQAAGPRPLAASRNGGLLLLALFLPVAACLWPKKRSRR